MNVHSHLTHLQMFPYASSLMRKSWSWEPVRWHGI